MPASPILRNTAIRETISVSDYIEWEILVANPVDAAATITCVLDAYTPANVVRREWALNPASEGVSRDLVFAPEESHTILPTGLSVGSIDDIAFGVAVGGQAIIQVKDWLNSHTPVGTVIESDVAFTVDGDTTNLSAKSYVINDWFARRRDDVDGLGIIDSFMLGDDRDAQVLMDFVNLARLDGVAPMAWLVTAVREMLDYYLDRRIQDVLELN